MSSNGPVRLVQRFENIETYAHAAQAFDVDVVQLGTGSLGLSMHMTQTEDFGVFQCGVGPTIHTRSVVHNNKTYFMLCLTPITLNGLETSAVSLAIMNEGREYSTLMHEGFRSIEVFVDNALLDRHPLSRIALDPARTQSERLFTMPRKVYPALRKKFETALKSEALASGQDWVDAVRLNVLDAILEAMSPDTVQTVPLSRSPAKRAIVERALDIFLDEAFRGDVAAVADTLGVSRRMLELSFKAVVGVSPGQYLIAVRLTRARELLLWGKAPVLETAAMAGFMHAGRFASQYAKQFGEKPSATLRRAKARLM